MSGAVSWLEPIRGWHLLDLVIAGYVGAGMVAGFATGFTRLAARLAATAAGFAAGAVLARPIGVWAASRWPALQGADRLAAERLDGLPVLFGSNPAAVPADGPGPVTLALAFLAAFALVRLVASIVLTPLLAVLALGLGSPLDRLLGAVLGLLQSTVLAATLLGAAVLLSALPGLAILPVWIDDSRLGHLLLAAFLRLAGWRA